MFTELKIKNFQSLSDCTIELGKITVIIGPSFLGKSAVVRALYSLVHNRFSSSYMKKGTSSTVIELKEGDKWVKYIRGNSSSYRYSENPEEFTKIGREVPKEIREFLNMDEVVFDKDLSLDFNFQKQFDSPFIIGLSGFEAAKVFGKMMNLDIVLAATREISKDIRALNKQMDSCQAIIDVSLDYIQQNFVVQLKYALLQDAIKVQEEIDKESEWQFMLEELLVEAELLDRSISLYEKLLASLEEAKIDSLETPPEALQDLIVQYDFVKAAATIYGGFGYDPAKVEFDIPYFQSLEEFIVSSEHVNKEYLVVGKVAKAVKAIDFSQVEQLEGIFDLVNSGDEVNKTFAEAKKEANQIRSSTVALQSEFDKFIAENNICPISKQPYTPSCLEAIRRG